MLSYEDLLHAYEWVSADYSLQNTAYVNRTSGAVYLDTDELDADLTLPEDIEDGSRYIAVPHKHDLDLGKALVFEFADEHLTDDLDKITEYFKRPGAYSRFKDLLERRNLLESWYKYERIKTFEALQRWATDNSIPHQFKLDANAA
jgi:hypothetical protein